MSPTPGTRSRAATPTGSPSSSTPATTGPSPTAPGRSSPDDMREHPATHRWPPAPTQDRRRRPQGTERLPLPGRIKGSPAGSAQASHSARPSPAVTVMAVEHTARRLHRLVEPIALVTYRSKEPTDALMALGHRNAWAGYFAGRAAPLGRLSAEAVHAIFYNFADGEVAHHIPRVWDTATPEAAIAAREHGSVAALRRILGDLADTPGLARAADLAAKAATNAPTEGRIMYAALRVLPMPVEPLARLWHAANMLREHRGDGHIAALMAAGIGGTEAHVLRALSEGIPPEEFGRLRRLPAARLAAVVKGMRDRGLIDDSGRLSDAGQETKNWIESRTDELAAPPYDGLEPSELHDLIADLMPIATVLVAVGSR
ncbi:SCO6745 family protein [Spirillospora sp. CA-255316]